MAKLYVGTSGWSYDHWEGVLYPPGTPTRDRLAIYTRRFDTVELNASFYRWPTEAAFGSWRRRLPAGFAMSVKAPRGLTHAKRLYGPEAWTERIARGWHELGERRTVVLVQLDGRQARDDARLEYLLAGIPRWMRTTVELRHASWHTEAVYRLLERHQAAYCVMSGAGLPRVPRATASFVYVRLHGPDHDALYSGSYSDQDLRWWRDRLLEWHRSGLDVYAYFNNDGHGHAVRNASTLRELCASLMEPS
ncbi:DUF72 domain-containing protein [Frankia nepalensis]|uniref:DUF72 domain-containing protein n=1 Tax=Frankia nepalensis TaxID=1836974 RepID=A0A937RL91_9ACTN|nr:DUF72 domain-containing protein [Frankia nepalensis]MBL7632330.1 DUF72 domain-containing protein [Frankia nepalensis]